jgi:deoxyribonuclease-1
MRFKAFLQFCLLVTFCFGIPNFVEESSYPIPTPPRNFTESKKIAAELFEGYPKTFYCGCQYDKEGLVNWDSCGYKPKSHSRRSKWVEWEHIMPAHRFGHKLPCWKEPICHTKEGKAYKGRRCCQKVDKQFIQMEADLHNLVPAIGEVNAARSNYAFGLLPTIKEQPFGACEIKIDSHLKVVEPRSKARGTIARAYLYMSAVYKIELTDKEKTLFNHWAKKYPPEEWEIAWDLKVGRIQGNHNSFIQKNN